MPESSIVCEPWRRETIPGRDCPENLKKSLPDMTAVMAAVACRVHLLSMQTGLDPLHGGGPIRHWRHEHAEFIRELDELDNRVLSESDVRDEVAFREAICRVTSRAARLLLDEDRLLYPLVAAACPALRQTLTTLTEEHAELRAMLASFSGPLAAPAFLGRDERIDVLLRDFIDLLRLHIQREESIVFTVVSRALTKSDSSLA